MRFLLILLKSLLLAQRLASSEKSAEGNATFAEPKATMTTLAFDRGRASEINSSDSLFDRNDFKARLFKKDCVNNRIRFVTLLWRGAFKTLD